MGLFRTVDGVARCAEQLPVTRLKDVEPGDCIIVSTKNSVYRLYSLGGSTFHVNGGWFDRNPGPSAVRLNGCTFGGMAICPDIVAGEGLFLEFGNNVSTTRIRAVNIERGVVDPLSFVN